MILLWPSDVDGIFGCWTKEYKVWDNTVMIVSICGRALHEQWNGFSRSHLNINTFYKFCLKNMYINVCWLHLLSKWFLYTYLFGLVMCWNDLD